MSNITGVGGATLFSPQPERAKSGGQSETAQSGGAVAGTQAAEQNDAILVSELKSAGPAPGVVSGESLVTSQIKDAADRFALSQPERGAGGPSQDQPVGMSKVVAVADPDNGLPVVFKFREAAEEMKAQQPSRSDQPLDKSV